MIKLMYWHMYNIIGGLDYVAILNQQLTFDASMSSHTVHVGIVDDDSFEENVEYFTATLSTNIPRLQLGVQLATVNIADNESKPIDNN